MITNMKPLVTALCFAGIVFAAAGCDADVTNAVDVGKDVNRAVGVTLDREAFDSAVERDLDQDITSALTRLTEHDVTRTTDVKSGTVTYSSAVDTGVDTSAFTGVKALKMEDQSLELSMTRPQELIDTLEEAGVSSDRVTMVTRVTVPGNIVVARTTDDSEVEIKNKDKFGTAAVRTPLDQTRISTIKIVGNSPLRLAPATSTNREPAPTRDQKNVFGFTVPDAQVARSDKTPATAQAQAPIDPLARVLHVPGPVAVLLLVGGSVGGGLAFYRVFMRN